MHSFERVEEESPVVPADARSVVAGVALSVVGLATFLLLPPFIEAAVSDLKFTESGVGGLSALIACGQTIANVLAGLWVRRSSWRTAAAVALSGLLLANLASIFCRDFFLFAALQCLGGLFGGSLYSLSMIVLSDSRRPVQAFACSIGAQTAYEIFGLIAGPLMIHRGMVTFLGLFSALSIVGIVLIPLLPEHGHSNTGKVALMGLFKAPVLLALIGCFLFFVNIGAYWTYIERLGTAASLSLSAVSNSLSFGTAASMGGVFLAVWLGNRGGVLWPIAVSALATVASILLLVGAPHLLAYAISAVIYGNAWNLSVTYQYYAVHVSDTSRCGVAVAPGMQNAGNAAGPAIAAIFVSEHDHSSVIWLVSISVLLSLACFALAMRLHEQATASTVPVAS